jgi:hypothetical protein
MQVWRLVTNFLFFGQWGVDYIFHMYFLYVLHPDALVLGQLVRQLAWLFAGSDTVVR